MLSTAFCGQISKALFAMVFGKRHIVNESVDFYEAA
jgi:hypothetical protein